MIVLFCTCTSHIPPQVPLTVDNIQTILDTLLYDGTAEVTIVAGQVGGELEAEPQRLYRATVPLVPSTGFSRVPCGVCPVSSPATVVSRVSPLLGVSIPTVLLSSVGHSLLDIHFVK